MEGAGVLQVVCRAPIRVKNGLSEYLELLHSGACRGEVKAEIRQPGSAAARLFVKSGLGFQLFRRIVVAASMTNR